MKKTWTILLALTLAVLFALPVSAERELGYVTDTVGILTPEQWQELELQAMDLADRYGFGVYVIVLDDFQNYVDTGSIREAARVVYRDCGLGLGENRDGLLLLLSLAEGDYALRPEGWGGTAFTDYGREFLAEAFLDDFSDERWSDGFSDYLTVSAEMLEAAAAGEPVDGDSGGRIYGVLACILLGFGMAFLARRNLKGRMKSVAPETGAGDVPAAGGLELTREYDRFTHTTQDRIYSPEKPAAGGTPDGDTNRSGRF